MNDGEIILTPNIDLSRNRTGSSDCSIENGTCTCAKNKEKVIKRKLTRTLGNVAVTDKMSCGNMNMTLSFESQIFADEDHANGYMTQNYSSIMKAFEDKLGKLYNGIEGIQIAGGLYIKEQEGKYSIKADVKRSLIPVLSKAKEEYLAQNPPL